MSDILSIPELAFEKILSYLSYDEIASNRLDIMADLQDEDNLLASLLDVAEAELNSLNGVDNTLKENVGSKSNRSYACSSTKEKFLSDVDEYTSNISSQKISMKKCDKIVKDLEKSVPSIYEEGVDSSDEEGNRNYENQKYNEYGKEIKSLLLSNKSSNDSSKSSLSQNRLSDNWKEKNINGKTCTPTESKTKSSELSKSTANVYTDPIFGISILNPLISSKVLQERMIGRKVIPICEIGKHLKTLKKDDDWVIAGVICSKGITKTSANGNQYIIWTMSDLIGNISTIALFLFGSAYKEFWKTQPGSVVGILNPSILDKREGSKDEAILSVDNAQKLLILGQSKDLATCKSTKKNGEKCTAIVNKSKCEVCIYHIKQEYQKCSRRSELQANYSGKGLIALRNKVLGKNEVFYAGKSYTAIPAKQSKKLLKKDQNRLQSLSGMVATSQNVHPRKKNTIHKAAASFDVVRSQRLKDIETLRKLGVNTDKYSSLGAREDFKGNHSSLVTLNESKTNALKVLSKLNEQKPNTSSFNSTKASNGKCNSTDEFHNSQLQKSLDDIVNNDLIDFNVDFKIGSNQVDKTIDNEKRSSLSTVKLGSLHDKGKKDFKVSSLNNTKYQSEEVGKPFEISQSFSVAKTNCEVSSEFEKNTCDPELSSKKEVKNKDAVQNKYTDLIFSNSSIMNSVPKLTKNDNYIDLNEPTISRQAHKAKLKALNIIQKNGPLVKSNPNDIKGRGIKRKFDIGVPVETKNGKKLKSIKENEFLSDRFKKMMQIHSQHLDLIEMRDNEEKQKYFKKLEVKEQLEEKMANTYKIECKAVRCLNCKYTNFSAADKCKQEKHRLKVFNAVKRFFKCGHCGNRIACLDVVPIHSCKNCGSGNWERTTMMKDKKVLNSISLSIRGGEQKYINSNVSDANINLLVPDED